MWLCFRIYHSSLAEHKIGITENKTLTIFLPVDLISMVKKFLFTIISYNSPTKLTLCNCTVCRNFRSQYCCSSPVTSVNRTAGYNQWANKQSFDLICCPMCPPQKLTKSHKHSHEARSTTVRPVICWCSLRY